ncbi:MAG: hypothetical protein HYV63_00830 [Candidatus Schekmanbacteria bacterium]|nr:hypothetical protein [Candidatus Schekmanbacteria bacterium]
MSTTSRTRLRKTRLILFLLLPATMLVHAPTFAEYGDVVINNFSDGAGIRPVVFPHWFHRIRFRCKVCHSDLGFKFQAGGNQINMLKIIDGEYCGGCHNGEVAWSVENCQLCHSGATGTRTQVHHNTLSKLDPASAAKAATTAAPPEAPANQPPAANQGRP